MFIHTIELKRILSASVFVKPKIDRVSVCSQNGYFKFPEQKRKRNIFYFISARNNAGAALQ